MALFFILKKERSLIFKATIKQNTRKYDWYGTITTKGGSRLVRISRTLGTQKNFKGKYIKII